MKDDTINRQDAIDVLAMGKELLARALDDMHVVGSERKKYEWGLELIESNILDLKELPSAQPEITRCKDCFYGYLYVDIQNGVTDSWIECRNPEGLNRDVSVNGYCCASMRKKVNGDAVD